MLSAGSVSAVAVTSRFAGTQPFACARVIARSKESRHGHQKCASRRRIGSVGVLSSIVRLPIGQPRVWARVVLQLLLPRLHQLQEAEHLAVRREVSADRGLHYPHFHALPLGIEPLEYEVLLGGSSGISCSW